MNKPEQTHDVPDIRKPPRRLDTWKLFCFLLHTCFLLFAIDIGSGIAFWFNLLFMAFYGWEIYDKYRFAKRMEREYRHLIAFRRIVGTPTHCVDENTNTFVYSWLVSLSVEEVDQMLVESEYDD